MNSTRSALVVAHPGHELMVHGWLEIARPRVFVLTDGSGHSNQSRVDSTTRILSRTGAERGSIYGRLTDSAAYAAILNHEFDLFSRLAEELAAVFVKERIDFVAGDAFEGYNPMHDVCRLLINAAVSLARRASSHDVANFEFSLINHPPSCPEPVPEDEMWLRLDEPALARKVSAAQGYQELAGEVHHAFGKASVNAFGVERLRAVTSSGNGDGQSQTRRNDEELPFYEQYGEKQVAAGHYANVIRYAEHIAPLEAALRRYAEGSVEQSSFATE